MSDCARELQDLERIPCQVRVRDVACWNKWKAARPPSADPVDLSGLDLSGADLSGIDLSYSNLRGVNLEAAKLRGADLRGVDLSVRKMPDGATQPSNLTDADLTGATLAGADLRRAEFLETNLTDADLRDTHGLLLDQTIIRGAKFSALSDDPWSGLRRRYTGSRMIFNLLFLTLFFLPLALRASGWATASRIQTEVVQFTDGVLEALQARPLDPAVRETLLAARARLAERELRPVPVWELVLRGDGERGFLFLSFLLLTYNLLRWLLTVVVAPMRDEEDRSGISPGFAAQTRPLFPPRGRRTDPHAWRTATVDWSNRWTSTYGWLVLPDRLVRVLFWAAMVSFVLQAREWLALVVWIPVG